MAEVESAVVLCEVYYCVHLLVNECGVGSYYGECDYGELFAVVCFDFGDGEIEAGFQAADEAFYDSSFLLEGLYAMEVDVQF